MPKAFENCVKKGGRVRTKKLSGGKYMHICFLNGKSYAGEIKKKEKGRKLSKTKKAPKKMAKKKKKKK